MHTNTRMFVVLLAISMSLSGCGNANDGDRMRSIIVEATGENFNWFFRYPGLDGVLGTDDDQHSVQNLFLPDHAAVTIKLKSKDYIYSFSLPELGLKEVAIPDLDFELQFNSESPRTLQLLGDQFCGYAHKTLIGEVRVLDQSNGFYGWHTDPQT